MNDRQRRAMFAKDFFDVSRCHCACGCKIKGGLMCESCRLDTKNNEYHRSLKDNTHFIHGQSEGNEDAWYQKDDQTDDSNLISRRNKFKII
jgi:hypothetical protein